MAFVNRYGNTISENGWRMVDDAECEWSAVPGTDVTLQIRKGVPTTILTAFAARYNQTVEPLRDPDSACYTSTNAVATSNHMSATACDFNWDSHPFHAQGTFGDRLPALRALLDEFRGCVWWGGDWQDPIDEMHFQLAYPEGDQRLIDLANSLPKPPPAPVSRADRYAIAIILEGRRLGITDRGIKIALSVALVESNLQNYANSNDPPSLLLPHDAVGSDHMSSGVFQQQPPWGPLECRMDVTCSARLFYDCNVGPGVRGLLHIPYDYRDESNTPGFYAQTVQGSAYPNRYDEQFGAATALYDRLSGAAALPPPEEEAFMSALNPDEQRLFFDRINQLWGALFNVNPSKSRYGDPNITWPNHMYIRNIDGHVYDLIVEHDAGLGDPEALWRIQNAAGNGDAKAQAFLERLAAAQTTAPPTSAPPAAPPPPTTQPPTPAPPPPSPPGQQQGSLTAAIDQFGAQMLQANTDFGQRMQDFKNALNNLIGG